LTTSPDFTKILVICPSTSGWTVVERRERRVAMNSDASSIGAAVSFMSLTPDGGGPCGAPCAGAPPRQAGVNPATQIAKRRAVGNLWECMGGGREQENEKATLCVASILY
jgi:hypothetical protein